MNRCFRFRAEPLLIISVTPVLFCLRQLKLSTERI